MIPWLPIIFTYDSPFNEPAVVRVRVNPEHVSIRLPDESVVYTSMLEYGFNVGGFLTLVILISNVFPLESPLVVVKALSTSILSFPEKSLFTEVRHVGVFPLISEDVEHGDT